MFQSSHNKELTKKNICVYGGSVGKNSACNTGDCLQETWVQSLGQEDPLEEETATHSSILAYEIPQTEKPIRQ